MNETNEKKRVTPSDVSFLPENVLEAIQNYHSQMRRGCHHVRLYVHNPFDGDERVSIIFSRHADKISLDLKYDDEGKPMIKQFRKPSFPMGELRKHLGRLSSNARLRVSYSNHRKGIRLHIFPESTTPKMDGYVELVCMLYMLQEF